MPRVLKSDSSDDIPRDNATIDAFYERLAYVDVVAASSYPVCYIPVHLHVLQQLCLVMLIMVPYMHIMTIIERGCGYRSLFRRTIPSSMFTATINGC
jgi:hypothetical protein